MVGSDAEGSRALDRCSAMEWRAGQRGRTYPARLPENLILNLAPIAFSESRINIGRLVYEDEEMYRGLCEKYRKTHVFRYDNRSNSVFNIGLKPPIQALGETKEVDTNDHLLLFGKVIQQTLVRWLASRRTIIRPSRPLICWGRRDAGLLSKALEELGLTAREGLEVVARHSFDTRVLQSQGNKAAPFLALVMDIGTSNVVLIAVSDLIASGLDVVGRYICRREEAKDDDILPKLDTLGRVTGQEGTTLLLTDTTAEDRVSADAVVLEQRQEHWRR